MNEDNLIRDLDILGVQDEVDLRFMSIHPSYSILPGIVDNEYKTCLIYNDYHRNKILSAKITYDYHLEPSLFLQHNLIRPSRRIHKATEIELSFSNNIIVRLSYTKAVEKDILNVYVYYRKELTNKFTCPSTLEGSMHYRAEFSEDNSIIDTFFRVVGDINSSPLIISHLKNIVK